MKIWSRFLYAGQKTFSTSSRHRWAGLVEIALASMMILGGFVFFVAALALQNLYSNSQQQIWYYSTEGLVLRLVLAACVLSIGFYRILVALWKVSASIERRGAIAAAAIDLAPFRDWNDQSQRYPNIPALSRLPVPGNKLRYRLRGRRRNYGWLALLAFITLAGFGFATTTGARFRFSWVQVAGGDFSGLDYSALAMCGIALGLGIWGAVGFFRQAMRLAAFGPTILEISDMPLIPGKKFQILLYQPGRFRFKLLDVLLVCEEVTTFSRGTDIQTQRFAVEEHRLLRQRGVNVAPTAPFETEIEFELPRETFHSFSSSNNQVQWKIVVQTIAKGWPQFEQTFPVVVYPLNGSDLSNSGSTP